MDPENASVIRTRKNPAKPIHDGGRLRPAVEKIPKLWNGWGVRTGAAPNVAPRNAATDEWRLRISAWGR